MILNDEWETICKIRIVTYFEYINWLRKTTYSLRPVKLVVKVPIDTGTYFFKNCPLHFLGTLKSLGPFSPNSFFKANSSLSKFPWWHGFSIYLAHTRNSWQKGGVYYKTSGKWILFHAINSRLSGAILLKCRPGYFELRHNTVGYWSCSLAP